MEVRGGGPGWGLGPGPWAPRRGRPASPRLAQLGRLGRGVGVSSAGAASPCRRASGGPRRPPPRSPVPRTPTPPPPAVASLRKAQGGGVSLLGFGLGTAGGQRSRSQIEALGPGGGFTQRCLAGQCGQPVEFWVREPFPLASGCLLGSSEWEATSHWRPFLSPKQSGPERVRGRAETWVS